MAFERLTKEGTISKYRHLFPNTIYSSRNRRLIKPEISFTVTSHCLDEILHPYLDRAISPREAARLQSFQTGTSLKDLMYSFTGIKYRTGMNRLEMQYLHYLHMHLPEKL